MPDSKQQPKAETGEAPAEAELEVKPVKDLEPDEKQSSHVRGGYAATFGNILNGRFSDVILKRDIVPLGDAIAKLRILPSLSAGEPRYV